MIFAGLLTLSLKVISPSVVPARISPVGVQKMRLTLLNSFLGHGRMFWRLMKFSFPVVDICASESPPP